MEMNETRNVGFGFGDVTWGFVYRRWLTCALTRAPARMLPIRQSIRGAVPPRNHWQMHRAPQTIAMDSRGIDIRLREYIYSIGLLAIIDYGMPPIATLNSANATYNTVM